VIKRPRASVAEHFASLAKADDKRFAPRDRTAQAKANDGSPKRPPRPPKPRPGRTALAAAEQALLEHQQSASAELATLRKQQERILAEIERLRKAQERDASRLARAVEKERGKYETALNRWRSS